MLQFNKLRINGFKSFVDRTELEIGPGLNGIVGPNGCGKSNLVEALRWVMGESSAKKMRGGGMEDVIFNGTSQRTARNIAEVSLLLDNSQRMAPAAFNEFDDIEVTRRIERDRGSLYKINGKTVRARDVQMLFADTVTGANSPALVSQGRVTQIINAKPLERRLILEESAGISGLYARRHEAELRLKAADANLLRIDDVLGGMEGRLNALKRQMRQALKYRNLNAQIRQLDLMIAYYEWVHLEARMKDVQKSFEVAESLVAQNLGVVTQLTKTQNTQEKEIQPLREAEAEAAASLQNKKLALQRLEDMIEQHEQQLAETKAQLAQAIEDQSHEKTSAEECSSALKKLESEHERLIATEGDDEAKMKAKQEAKEALETKVAELEKRYTSMMQAVAESKAHKESLESQIKQNKARIDVVRERKEKTLAQIAETKTNYERAKAESKSESVLKELQLKSESLESEVKAKSEALKTLSAKIESAKEEQQKSLQALSSLKTEIETLESLFSDTAQDGFEPLMNVVSPNPGFEKALSQALGDALMASMDNKAPKFWVATSLSKLPKLPGGLKPLADFVKAPKVLSSALSQIGYLADVTQAETIAQHLQPGQAMISHDGEYWRWDGFRMRASAKDHTAQHLEQKNKLAKLKEDLPAKQDAADNHETETKNLMDEKTALQDQVDTLQEQLQGAKSTWQDKQQDFAISQEKLLRYEDEIKRLEDALKLSEEDIMTLEEIIGWDEKRLAQYDDASDQQKTKQSEELYESLREARQSHQDALQAFEAFRSAQNSRQARLRAIADERVSLKNRLIRSEERLKELKSRQASLEEKLKALESQPKDSEAEKEHLLEIISKLETARNAAAEKLASFENEIFETARALKQAENSLSESREKRAGAQATLSSLNEQKGPMEQAIAEKFEMQPQELKQHIQISSEDETPQLSKLKEQRESLVQDREALGPVNLRAEDEVKELEGEVGGLIHERNDLVAAIEELRGGIQTINKEARARLLAAFEHVNAHFQSLFTRLFAGGQAHLSLIDSDDPLGAGLEIFAQPPGKTLQSLSLLSGGEQTLASIALIFAMFLTNPSPICVLDEIDAPLDDANVDRVCDLLEHIAAKGKTRFLIITHHRLTMARMDWLYGVTMAEQGVSQLVSVDLQQSFDFLEEAA